jgi:two-component system NtrC family sensor kinase
MDPHQMQQVFLNIIVNAIQATEEKEGDRSLRISTEVIEERARIIFQDNGIGISTEDLANIFNPFFTTKPVGAGTGLGLSLAYGIVREHNGSIEVESTPGSGATFTIDLPVVERATDDSARPHRERHSGIKLSAQTDQKILVIDDEQEILDLIREALVARGYQVDTVADGNSGITLARQKAYDLVVCDWKMPGSGGQQIYEQIRQIKPHSAQRFVFITGDVLSRTAEQFLQAEDKVCLQKPFSVDEFRTTVERILNSN